MPLRKYRARKRSVHYFAHSPGLGLLVETVSAGPAKVYERAAWVEWHSADRCTVRPVGQRSAGTCCIDLTPGAACSCGLTVCYRLAALRTLRRRGDL